MRRRLRGKLFFRLLFLCALILSGVLLIACMVHPVGHELSAYPEFGRGLMAGTVLRAIRVAGRALSRVYAAIVSDERERGTLEMLFLTPLTPSALVTGKFWRDRRNVHAAVCRRAGDGHRAGGLRRRVVHRADLRLPGAAVQRRALSAACGLFASCQFRRSYFTLPLGYLAMLLLLPATTVGLCLPVLVGEFGTLALAVMHVMITVTLTIGLLRLCDPGCAVYSRT